MWKKYLMTIHFWHSLQPGPVSEIFHHEVDQWNRSQSQWKVELNCCSQIYSDPVHAAFSLEKNAEQPQLILGPQYAEGKLITDSGIKKIIPIGELIEHEYLDKIARIVKFTFGDKDGNLLSLPLNPACGVIFSNQDVLKKAGMDPHFIPRSIEELEEICQELIQKGLVEFGYTCAWPAAYLVEIPAAQQDFPLIVPDNGRPDNERTKQWTYQFKSEWLIRHLLDLREQQKKGIFVYAGRDNNSRHFFTQGRVAFYFQGSSHNQLLDNESKFTLGCGELPTLVKGQQEKYAFPLGGASVWVINSEATQTMIEGVKAFLKFLAGEDFQERWHKQIACVPVSLSLSSRLKAFYQDNPLHKAVVSQTIEAKLGRYSFGLHAPNYEAARKELFALIEKILDVNTQDQEVEGLLAEFDQKFSFPEESNFSKI